MARTRAQDYDTKRQAILHSSAELFARFGYSGTSITMIADACGVSKALLYHYYSDKEALLFDIISAHLESLIQAVEAAAAAAEGPKARLEAICAALLEAYRDADAEHQIQIANLKLLPKERQEILRGMERTIVVLFSDAIAEAVPEVGRGPLLKPVTMSLFGMLNWHYLWFRDGKGLTRTDYARLVTALISGGAAQAMASVGVEAEAVPAKGADAQENGQAAATPAPRPTPAAGVKAPAKPRTAAAKPRATAAKARVPAKAL
ncbi:TetR/AcrR family transcriptional regulator [Aquabacter cavernae]|uniref:TetR/AcrR family transcriptional regulator n=1 Tax=Aquabacter cavernae TaxID=2496029 RepID=UPI000F8CB01F|nr:TetR/AcrR family transcriptional regulator [Aquabacter cavernae]